MIVPSTTTTAVRRTSGLSRLSVAAGASADVISVLGGRRSGGVPTITGGWLRSERPRNVHGTSTERRGRRRFGRRERHRTRTPTCRWRSSTSTTPCSTVRVPTPGGRALLRHPRAPRRGPRLPRGGGRRRSPRPDGAVRGPEGAVRHRRHRRRSRRGLRHGLPGGLHARRRLPLRPAAPAIGRVEGRRRHERARLPGAQVRRDRAPRRDRCALRVGPRRLVEARPGHLRRGGVPLRLRARGVDGRGLRGPPTSGAARRSACAPSGSTGGGRGTWGPPAPDAEVADVPSAVGVILGDAAG